MAAEQIQRLPFSRIAITYAAHYGKPGRQRYRDTFYISRCLKE
jgi:hypothetical protein